MIMENYEILSVRHLYKSIKHNEILRDLSLSVKSGEVLGIVGRNGSGKSMLFKIICGIVLPDSGEISICGENIRDAGTKAIGALIEGPAFLPNFTGYENLKLISSLTAQFTKEECFECLKRVGLNPSDKKKYKAYSLGMRQKLSIASTIIGTPRILLLDEPFNNLDLETTTSIRTLLKTFNEKYGVTIVLCSHSSEDYIALCDRIVILEKGKITDAASSAINNC